MRAEWLDHDGTRSLAVGTIAQRHRVLDVIYFHAYNISLSDERCHSARPRQRRKRTAAHTVRRSRPHISKYTHVVCGVLSLRWIMEEDDEKRVSGCVRDPHRAAIPGSPIKSEISQFAALSPHHHRRLTHVQRPKGKLLFH